ncbi:uncharacterized protein LOC127010909 [Drosophila biarmipes]|uniref:uncharacterized protein LOC127010909 n=1 Tax=Drosophila biarmipes TaxID=125945 RepID=UPI0021CC66DD|nr:uncharacterized protein LOC127010909 [Drosophila biarmipes]
MTNKNLYFVLTFISLIHFTTYAKLINNTLCVDCRPESKELCTIESETGYSCKHWTKKSESRTRKSESKILDLLFGEDDKRTTTTTKRPTTPKPEVTSDLDVCLPPDLNFTENDFKVCCVWSPKLGCQVLVSASYTSRYCLQCRQGVGDGLEPCPCKEIEESSSARRCCRSLDAVIATYIATLMIFR